MDMVSFVFQDTFLFYDTLYENIAVGSPDATKEKVIAAAKAAQCHDFIERLPKGYETRIGDKGVFLSGGEAQRLKLAGEMGKGQSNSVFVFDEPTIGLHPLDVQTLMEIFQKLVESGATVIVIEHDLDVIRNADYIIDMGPGGGNKGGRIVACGTPEQIAACPESVTGKYV